MESDKMTYGTMIFIAGAGILILAIIFNFVLIVTAKEEKRKIDAKMKERY